ncbi:hypothetical protein ACM66B_000367 [Microbotryomycetes sp. NB124-2]
MRRLIVLADGTWEDADFQSNPDLLTNISRLSRALHTTDTTTSPPVVQIKRYSEGLGTGSTAILGALQGARATGLMTKVRHLYDWLCLNYEPGATEVTLVGFSRGAYCVRLLASLIGQIGFLKPSRMHEFPALVDALCAKWEDGVTEERLRVLLDAIEQDRLAQVRQCTGGFLIKTVLVFDTVPVQPSNEPKGHPANDSPIEWNAFGLQAEKLEPHIETALQALAINEARPAYKPLLFKRDPLKLKEGQKLTQVWFVGAHTDVGGGYEDHDLADISLMWAVDQLQRHAGLSFDTDYLEQVTDHPTSMWGHMQPHKGISFGLPPQIRAYPAQLDPTTNELFHASVLQQPPTHLPPHILTLLSRKELFTQCGSLELQLQQRHDEALKRQSKSIAPRINLPVTPASALQTKPRTKMISVFKTFIEHEQEKLKGAGNAGTPPDELESDSIAKRQSAGTSCKLPQHNYNGGCVYPCPSPGYFVKSTNTCYLCGSSVKSCNSTGVIACSSPSLFISGKTCVASCPTGTFAWQSGKRCITCPSGQYLNQQTGKCTSQNLQRFARLSSHKRTALMDSAKQDGDLDWNLQVELAFDVDCAARCINAATDSYRFNWIEHNAYYDRCICRNRFGLSQVNYTEAGGSTYSTRFTGGVQVDYLYNYDCKYNAYLIKQYYPDGTAQCTDTIFVGSQCYVESTKQRCQAVFPRI